MTESMRRAIPVRFWCPSSGGILQINASGDGLDSNGDIVMTGGEVYVSGPTGDGNGSLDYSGECRIDGGLLFLAGSTGMLQNPGEDSGSEYPSR